MNTQSHPIRVLLVDDDEDYFIVVRDLLSDFFSTKCMPRWASDYEAGLDAILSSEFDVCLLDYRLKERNGLEFMQEAVSRGAMTPIVLLTGQECFDLALEAASNGAADCLNKGELSAPLLERSIRYAMERQRQRDELIKAKRVMQALSECNHAVIHIKDEAELLRAICRIVVDVGGYRMAWAGYAEEDRDRTVTPVARYGYEKNYLETVKLTWKDIERGKGPTGTCIRTGLPSITRSVVRQAEFAPWKAEALTRGYASTIGLPLLLNGQRLGALSIYSSETDAFDREEVEFLVKLSSNVSHGLAAMRHSKAEMQAEESLKEANRDLERQVEERKLAEEALRESEVRYRTLFESIDDGFCIIEKVETDPEEPIDFRYLTVNQAFATQTGLGYVQGMTMREVVPEESQGWFDTFDTVLRTGEPVRFELELASTCRILELCAFRVEDEMRRRVAVIFKDISERKQAEEALRESETRLRQIIDLVPHRIFVKNCDGKYLLVNTAAAEGYNTSVSDLTGKYQADFHPDESQLQKMLQDDQDVILKGETKFIPEEPFTNAQGNPHFLQTTKVPFQVPGDKTPAVLGISIDVTDKKRVEEALRENQSRLELALRSAGMGVWSIDLIESKRQFDDHVCHLLGLDPAQFTGTAEEVYKAVHPDNREMLKAALARTIEQEAPFETEYRTVWPDGSVHCIITRGKLFRDETGEPVKVKGLLWDVTEHKLAEEEANRQRETLSRIFESAPYVMMLVNKDGRVTDINRKGVAFGGEPKEELLGLLGGEVFSCLNSFEGLGCGKNPECTNCPVRTRVMHTFETGQDIQNAEGRLTKRSNSTDVAVDMLISTTLVKDKDDDKVLITITDITDQKQAHKEREKLRERLLQVQKIEAIGQLAGGVAHDFNNMLAVILGHSEMALEQTNPEDDRYFDLQEIIKAADRSADITRQLLAFARRQTVSPEVLDLNDTIPNMLKMLQRLIGEDIDLAWMPGHDLWSVEIDPSQVDQMLANLAVNARDAIAGVGKVTIETANVAFDGTTCNDREEFAAGEYVLLAVTDTGAGMSKEVMDHIFEPFFTTKEVGKGTGLGLATLYGIVKQNQGFVYVYSEPGQGTTFKIYLPKVKGESIGQETEISADKPPVGSETVLLVEDEEAIMNLGKKNPQSTGIHGVDRLYTGEGDSFG